MSERAGWVALHRSIFDDAPRPFCEGFAWAYTFAFATYRDRPDYSPPLTRGQLATTAGKLATAWGWERQRVRDTLRRWERAGQISTQGAGRCTVLTVVNYDVHQSVEKVPQPRPNRAPQQRNKKTKEQKNNPIQTSMYRYVRATQPPANQRRDWGLSKSTHRGSPHSVERRPGGSTSSSARTALVTPRSRRRCAG